jgi:formylglycine-generating enzyme required for sulfatase activity
MPPSHPAPRVTDKAWYIHDQAWSVLVAADPDTRYQCLNPQLLRPMRKQSTFLDESKDNPAQDGSPVPPRRMLSEVDLEQHWMELGNRESVLGEAFDLPEHGTFQTRRLCIVSDAGMGKTKLMEWLHFRINQADLSTDSDRKGRIALALNFTELEGVWKENKERVQRQPFFEMLLQFLANRFVTDRKTSAMYVNLQLAQRALERVLETCAHSGRLTLLADGLDQVENKQELLQEFLNTQDERIQRIRLIVAGRSNAVLGHWTQVFQDPAWTFVRVEPFRRDQQVRFLGWLPSSDRFERRKLRYSQIPNSAREILSIPRVLEYLLEVDDFSDLRTPADVYSRAIDRMIEKGNMLLPETQRSQATPKLVLELLARQAFHSFFRHVDPDRVTFQPNTSNGSRVEPDTWSRMPSTPETPPPEKYLYNIEAFDSSSEMDVFKDAIQVSASNDLQSAFKDVWDAVQKLNQFLDYGIFDADQASAKGRRLVWANRSLHEFLLAYYFANHANVSESNALWDRIYLPDQVATDDFYPFWQFLCDMPSTHCNPTAWLRSIEVLYWPNISNPDAASPNFADANPQYPFYAKRSNEMIYRSWSRLDQYCGSSTPATKRVADSIRNRWWGEFEDRFLAGKLGSDLRTIAVEVQTHLLPIPAGTVKMGTTRARQELPGALEYTRKFLADFRDEGKLAAYFDSKPYFKTHAGKIEREHQERYWRSVSRLQEPTEAQLWEAALISFSFGIVSNPEYHVDAFALGRQTIRNGWYRLYDARHGRQWSKYGLYSETHEHPAVAIAFFDAWVYCQWLRWNLQSCRLPFESEWEYAAKLGFESWEHDFWWESFSDPKTSEPKFDPKWINWDETTDKTRSEDGCTQISSPNRASPWSKSLDQPPEGLGQGLMDLQGNVWEWTQDRFRADHADCQDTQTHRATEDASTNTSVFRVLRGGSFASGRTAAVSCRARFDPSDALQYFGCRVARASLRKS